VVLEVPPGLSQGAAEAVRQQVQRAIGVDDLQTAVAPSESDPAVVALRVSIREGSP